MNWLARLIRIMSTDLAKMKNNRNEIIFKCAIMAILLLILDIIILFLYVNDFINVFFLVFFHGIVFIAACIFVIFCKNSNEDLLYPLLLALYIFGLGAFGSLGFLIQMAFFSLYSRYAKPAHVWLKGIFPKPRLTKFYMILQRIESKWDDYGQPQKVLSFIDIFKIGTLAQKQAVLDAIAKEFIPSYSPILKLGLEDRVNVVRIQAAAIVSKLSFDLEQKLNQLIGQYKHKPNESNLSLLANHCETFSSVDIIDSFRRREVSELAIEYYQKMIKINPDDQESWYAIGRILFVNEKFEKYILWYKECKEKLKDIPEVMHDRYLEATYRLKKFNEQTQLREK